MLFLKFDKQNKNNQKKNNFHFKVRIKHIKRQRENSGWNTEDSFLNVFDCAPFYKTLKYKIYIM